MSWTAPNLQNKHCFFGRKGGVSKGEFAGLNVSPKGCANEEELVQNLGLIAKFFDLERKNLALLNQGVSAEVFYIEHPSRFELTGDGMVTDKPNIILGLRTADCAPVLLEDKQNNVIGAAHAGWRGALKGVIEKTIDLMIKKGADLQNITAAIGPCIAQDSYEVDDVFYQTFTAKDKNYEKYFVCKKDKHFQFDLECFCIDRLKNYGIKNVEASGCDTYANEDEYYSFRRFTHKGTVKANGGFAAQLSAIVMRE